MGDDLDGQTVTHIEIQRGGLDGNRLAFWVLFDSGQSLYVEELAPPFLTADFDEDGDVDGADFLAWQRGNGINAGAVHGDGDANGDGIVNGADFGAWEDQYGRVQTGAAAASGSAVPEPSAFLLLLIAVSIFGCRNRIQRQFFSHG